MVLSNSVLSPQAFVEYLTGYCYSFKGDDPREEIHKILRINRIENSKTPIRDWSLQDIDKIVEDGASVVLVDVLTIDSSFTMQPAWRWFEVPARLVKKFQSRMNDE